MRILSIAPVPPPVHGQSLAVKVFLDELVKTHHVAVINTNKDSFKSGLSSFGRINQIGKILKDVWMRRRNNDVIYFTISESFAGNMKDLLIYLICLKSRDQTVIHMLGGAGMKAIIDHKGWQYKLNKYFISRLGGIIVEGETQCETFSQMTSRKKIHIVPNFAEDFLFLTGKEVEDKFSNVAPLKILFLSNLIPGKGHEELVDAYLGLKDELSEKAAIVFVGGFESDKDKSEFLRKIDGHKGLIYQGTFISGYEKKALYSHTHIFCLPSYYPYEGQPISILEAYATGCVVVTTNHSGIKDVFKDGVNGFEVQKRSADSIKSVLEQIISSPERLLPMAITNKETAYDKYRTSIYQASLMGIIEGIRSGSNDDQRN
jgi:glycosyltransferase involved in cell wall biosynthesis